MTLRVRRIIYSIFIFIFLIITPVIILYAAGYRYNFQKHKIQKTGVLILKSKPEGAKIFLNDKLKKTTTPARIANLLPGDYSIKIEKDDFYSWQKKLPVESGLTTFAEDVTLFKKSLPAQIVDGNIDIFSVSPNEQKLIYIQNQEMGNELWLLDFKTSKKSLLYRLSDKNNQILTAEWSKDGQKILMIIADNKLKNKKYIVLDSRTEEASVYSNLDDFYFEFKAIKNKIIDITSLDDAVLVDSPPAFITILNKKNRDLKVTQSDSGNIVFETEADIASWSEDGEKLLYLKNFEIWIYDFSSEKDFLITRYSKEIKNALWINNNYILALFDNTLKIIELDEREQRNVTDFLTLERIHNFNIDTKNQKIYFIGAIANKKGVFELPY